MISNIYIIVSAFFIISMFLFAIFLWSSPNKSRAVRAFSWLIMIILLWLILDLATSCTFLNKFQTILIWRIGFIASLASSLMVFRFILIF
ncbi:hypothetical protein K8R66_03435, partial [bacterium]|nr:hypothetical protein [bacterium]